MKVLKINRRLLALFINLKSLPIRKDLYFYYFNKNAFNFDLKYKKLTDIYFLKKKNKVIIKYIKPNDRTRSSNIIESIRIL